MLLFIVNSIPSNSIPSICTLHFGGFNAYLLPTDIYSRPNSCLRCSLRIENDIHERRGRGESAAVEICDSFGHGRELMREEGRAVMDFVERHNY